MPDRIPQPDSIHGLTDEQLRSAIEDAECREMAVRNELSELRLHRMMRKHVKRQHIKENIERLREQLEAIT